MRGRGDFTNISQARNKACSSFPAPYTNRRHGLYYIIDYLQKQTTLDKLKSPPVQILDSYAEIHNFDMEIFK